MPRIRPSERAFNIISHTSRQLFLCRACRAQFIRQLHSSPRVLAEERPFLQRMKDSLFGSRESKEKDAKRNEAQSKALQEAAADDPTKLKIKRRKGATYRIAPVIDPKGSYEGYTPATTWDNLEHIGGTEYARKVNDRGEVYQGFMPSKRAQLDDTQMVNLLHHIVVEILALQKAGRSLNQACYPRDFEDYDWKHTFDAGIELLEHGAPSLEFKSKDSEDAILKAIPYEQLKEQKQAESTNSFPTFPANWADGVPAGTPPPWMSMKITDPTLKLVLTKCLLQRTGHRPSDFLISSATTLEDLYNAFKAKEAPKKLAQSEQMQTMNTEIPNVTVHAKKRTLITKEKAVGRWKLIEEELINRNLPVTGSRWRGAKPTVTAEWVR